MPSGMSRAETFGLSALALLGTAGGSVFGALASEGGEGHLRNIILGVVCAIVLVSVTAINRFIDIRFLRGRGIARERAVAARERAAFTRRGLNGKLPRSRTTRRPVSSSGCGRGCHRCCTAWRGSPRRPPEQWKLR
jgi:hypothetical protein